MKHTITHSLKLYKKTALNMTIGSWYFRNVLKKKAYFNSSEKFIILSFDPDERGDIEMMPWLLDKLREHDCKASFAAVGVWVEKYPLLWKRVLAEGHEIINHTQTHPDNIELNPTHYHHLTKEQRKTEIQQCHETVKRVLGFEMHGFRTPHFGYQHTKDTYDILAELGYTFSTSTLAIDTPYLGLPYAVRHGPEHTGVPVIEFPLSPCPKHPWALFDSSHAFRGRLLKHHPKDYLKTFEELLDSNLFLNIYLDPQDFTIFDFDALLRMIKEKNVKTRVYGELLPKTHKKNQIVRRS